MQYLLRHIILYVFIASLNQDTTAQVTATYTITGNDNSPQILVLKKHSKGYFLLGTTNGLYRFDSHVFTPYAFSKNTKATAITAIAEDRNNRVWLGFQNGEIGFLKSNMIELLSAEEGHPAVAITSIVTDTSGIVYFTTAGEGIYYYKNKRFYNINMDDGLSDNYVYTITIVHKQLLANTDRGLNWISLANNQKKITSFTSSDGLPDNIVRCLSLSEKDGNYWIGMQDKGIGLYTEKSTKDKLSTLNKWKYGQVNSLLTTGDQLWIATEDSGIVTAKLNENKPYHLTAIKQLTDTYNKASNLLQDNEGNIWFTSKERLVKTNGVRLQNIISFSETMFAQAHTLLADKAGNFWLNTTNGLKKYYYDHSLQKWQSSAYLSGVINSKTDITCLYEDLFGNIWIGTLGKGVYVMNASSGASRHLAEDSSIANANVLSITGKGNELWISHLSGIVHCNLTGDNKDIFHPYNFLRFKTIGSIGSNYIYSIFIDSRQRVWFATDGKGLSVYDHNYFKNYNQDQGIKSLVIYNICEDLNGNIWFSALNDGLYKFDGEKFTNLSVADGLNDATVTSMSVDHKNNILAITKNGINIINAATRTVTYIDKNQEINKVNTDLNCISAINGVNYFISNNGIVKYTAPDINSGPEIIIEGLKIFSQDIDISVPGKFSYDENNFTFYYTGVSFSHPDKVLYQYKIQDRGINTDWITTKDNNNNIPKLPPGKYVFKVRASLNNSFEGSKEATYTFTIKKPLWLQWWFILLSGAIIMAILYAYVWVREKRLKRLEGLEKEKIQARFEVLKTQVNPHFLFNSFNTLISVIEDDQQLAVEYVEHLSDFYRKTVTYRDKDVVTLHEELDIVYNYLFIQKKRFGENLLFTDDVSTEEKSKFFIAPLTLQLLTENAIKHNSVSATTPLSVKVFIEDDCLVIENNINPKLTVESSAGMGLQNITNRYKLLTNRNVSVDQAGKNFIVKIPLLKSQPQ